MRIAWTKLDVHPANKDIERMGSWFVLLNLSAAFWLLAWTDEDISLSAILMLVQFICLAFIHRRIGMFDTRRSAASKWFTQIPLSIYFGWITVAAIANGSSYLNSTDWDGWGLDPTDWTNILIGITVFIGVLVMTIKRNVFYGLAIIWGLYGIILKCMETDSALYFHILRTAWIGISLLSLIAVMQIIKNRVIIKHTETFPVAPHPLK
jgi:hypothetical protein